MKTSSVAVIFATTFFIFIAGCASSPPPEPIEKIDANSTIDFLNKKLPDLKKQFYDINKKIEKAELEKINVTEVKILIKADEQKINDIEVGLNNAKAYFSNNNFVLANQTAHSAENNFNYLQENLNLAVDKLKEAYSKHAIQNAEMTLSDMKNQSKYFKDNVSIADNEGVNVANISKYIQLNEQYISTADANLNSAKSYLYTKNYDSIYLKINDTNNEIQIIQNNLNQGIKNLQDEYNRTITFSQELLTQTDIEIRTAEIYLTDAQNSGADIIKFQSKYDQAKATSDQAHEALSSRQFKAIKPKTDFATNLAKEIESEALDTKYDTLSKKAIQSLMEQVDGTEALDYIEKAHESRLGKKYKESIILANKAVVATTINMIESRISDLENFSTDNAIGLNLNSIKNNIGDARASMDSNDLQNSLQLAQQTNNPLKDSIDAANKYLQAKYQIEKTRKISLLWVSADTSQADEYLNKTVENIKLGNFNESIKYSNLTMESTNKTESETMKKIDDNIILRLIQLVKGVVSKEQTSMKPEEIQFIDVSYLNLVDVKFTPPEVNIDPKSLRQTAPSISFQNVSVNTPQVPSKDINIEKTKKFSARVEKVDYSGLKLGKISYSSISIYNDGTETIISERVEVFAERIFGWPVGYQNMAYAYNFNETIDPGNNRNLVQKFDLPTEKGISLTGNYDVTIRVYSNGYLVYSDKRSVYLST